MCAGHPARSTRHGDHYSLNRKLRMGLFGGGQGTFMGRVHAAAKLEGLH